MTANKVFLLGLDSTSLPFIKENLGALPTLRELLRQGHVVETENEAPLFTASDYATFASGSQAGGHGYYFPMQWDSPAMKFRRVGSEWPGFEPFWHDFARDGIDTVVFDAVDVPLAPNALGIQITEWNTQESIAAASNPPGLLRELERRFGRRPIGEEVRIRKSRRNLEQMRDTLVRSLRTKTDAILWMLEKFDWRFFHTAYCEAHRAGHNLWPIKADFASDAPENAMLDVYRELDTQLARLLSALDLSNTSVVLFSTRGMKPCDSQDHFVRPILDRVNELYMRTKGEAYVSPAKSGLFWALRRSIPAPIQLHVRQMVGPAIADWVVDREYRSGRRWKQTPAFPLLSGGEGWIRLNLEGREKEGILSSKDASEYVDFLCRHVRALRVMGTNEPLVRDVIMMQEEFPGARSYLLPDIALDWQPEEPHSEIWSQELGTIMAQSNVGRGGNHCGDSYAILTGALPSPDRIPPLRHISDYKNFSSGLLREAAPA